MIEWLQQHGVEALIAVLLAVSVWIIKRAVATQDSHETRISGLETDRVTREDFDELRASLTATAAHNQERTESRMDRLFEKISELQK